MELDLLYLVTVVPAILLFGISKAGLGGSVALVSIPLMTIVMPFHRDAAFAGRVSIFCQGGFGG